MIERPISGLTVQPVIRGKFRRQKGRKKVTTINEHPYQLKCLSANDGLQTFDIGSSKKRFFKRLKKGRVFISNKSLQLKR